METWIDEKEWSNMKKWMPKEFNWKCEFSTREKRKGRAMEGIITGVRKNLNEEEEGTFSNKNIVKRKIRINNETFLQYIPLTPKRTIF